MNGAIKAAVCEEAFHRAWVWWGRHDVAAAGGAILTEGGDAILTEAGERIVEESTPSDAILTEGGDAILTEVGDRIGAE